MSIFEDHKIIAKLIANLALDYVRWTQLVPMVLGWAFVIIMVLAMFLIAFQGEIDSLLQRAEPTVERWLGPAPEASDTQAEHTSGVSNFTEDDILPWIYRIWGGLAFIAWIFSMLRTRIFGPRPPKKLKRKISVTALASLIFIILLFIGSMLLGGFGNNTLLELTVPFILIPILLFIVSAWGLSISHIIDKIQIEIEKFGEKEPLAEQSRTTV